MSNFPEMKLPSPAKLNLFLHICGRRDDGYHELQTLFHFIDFCDWLTFHPNQTDKIVIEGMPIANEDNLIYKAAKLLKNKAEKNAGVTIKIEKNLPMGAGIGGGSSNAATTLLALNKLWQLNMSDEEMRKLALSLGADVPIFVFGHTAWAEGVGEKLTPLAVQEKWYILVLPDCHACTTEFYSHSQLTRDTKKKRIAAFLDVAQRNAFRNDFEPLARKLHPEIENALNALSNFGQARMTGSGSGVFLAFDEYSQAEQVALTLQPNYKAIIVKGINKSPTLSALESC